MGNSNIAKSRRCAPITWWKNSLNLALIAGAMQFGILLPNATACECVPAPPPCVAYTETEIIFLGTVTESKAGLARMRIDRAYKGISEKTVVLWDGGMCDGPGLHVGEQYLMYTRHDGSGYLPARGCTRSRIVRDAKEDLAFLNGLSKAPPTATIFGTVTERTGRIYAPGNPASGAVVEIQGEGKNRKVTSNQEGRYLFSGLPPGLYSVKVSLPGFTQSKSESDDPVEVISRGCGLQDVTLRKNWNGLLSGHVIRADGEPGPVWMNVDLIRVDGEGGKSELLTGFTVQTDEHGGYSFRGVAPGFYKIVLNLYQAPTAEHPYGMIYWPTAKTEATASSIEVRDNASSRQFDFRLPPPVNAARVTVIVLLPDGTPARDANASIVTRLDRSVVSTGTAVTDSYGQFSFEAVEGYEYTVLDIRTRDARMSGERPFSAADGVNPVTIRLVKREP